LFLLHGKYTLKDPDLQQLNEKRVKSPNLTLPVAYYMYIPYLYVSKAHKGPGSERRPEE